MHRDTLNDVLLNIRWASYMAQWVKCFPCSPDDLNLIPRTHVERENWLLNVVL